MTIDTGSRLGPYEITGRLGAGGMGEVFRARDTRIGRAVAVKVLPASLVSNTDRLQRFETESRAAGSLNHPNLVTIYDVGTEGGTPYIVMEIAEGETLREKLRDGRLSPRTTIDYASQIAAGLAAAHEKGIVHRDLKPENIFVTSDDRVKILDFGLAKLTQAAGDSNDTDAHTMARNTDPGTVLGTVGYMSPEQVRGQNVDHRSDIFSFGSILFEMLTGKRPFAGDSSADTMSAILREDPPEISATSGITPALDRIVRHCLEKNPAARFQSARDLAFDLQNLSNLSTSEAERVSGKAPRRFSSLAFVAAIVAAAAIASLATWLLARRNTRPDEVPRYTPVTFRIGNMMSARFAADGSTIYYGAAYGSGASETFSVRNDGTETHALGIPQSDIAAVSPTGEVAVLLKTRSLRVPLGSGTLAIMSQDGAPRPVAENVKRAAFSPDGKSMAVLRSVGGHTVLEYPIGHPIYEGMYLEGPRISADGQSVLIFGPERPPFRPMIIDRNGHVKTIDRPLRNYAGFAWSAKGDEIICACGDDDSTLAAIDLKGNYRVLSHFPSQVLLHDMLPNGRLLIESSVGRSMIGIASNGKESDLSWLGTSTVVDLTPDGKQVLFGEYPPHGTAGAFLRPLDGGPAIRLGDALPYAISPDGAFVIAGAVDTRKLLLLPTGAGLQREIDTGSLGAYAAAFLTPKSLLVLGFDENQRQEQIVLIDIDSGKRRIVTTGVRPVLMRANRDASRVTLGFLNARPLMLTMATGKVEPIEGLEIGDFPYQWTTDQRGLFIGKVGQFPAPVDLFDLATHTRTHVTSISTPDPNGVFNIDTIASTADGKTHAYSYLRVLTSTLYVVDGLR